VESLVKTKYMHECMLCRTIGKAHYAPKSNLAGARQNLTSVPVVRGEIMTFRHSKVPSSGPRPAAFKSGWEVCRMLLFTVKDMRIRAKSITSTALVV